jgi:hypothetical protein
LARALDDVAALAAAEQIAESTGTALVSVQPHEYLGVAGRIALFGKDGVLYSLAPGGEATVGFDASQFQPTADQEAAYKESAGKHNLPDIRSHIDKMTSPLRTVRVPTLLVALEAVDAAEEYEPDLEAVIEELAEEGKRLMTPDEWEYACGAGAATLFRWGDEFPMDREPDSIEGPHRELNAFGLKIGQNPYEDERTADPGVICGGDGGGMVHYEFFLGWLTLATSFRDAHYAQWIADNAEDVDQMYIRPVIQVE